MKAFYERYWSEKLDGKLSDFDRKWPILKSRVPTTTGITILDYGCGNGEIIAEMHRINPAARYVGVDVSEAALESARRHLPEVAFHRVPDGGRVPMPDGSVDFLFCSEVIEHIYDTEATFAEFARLLRPGGRLLLTTPYHGLVKNLLLVLLAFDKHFDPIGPHVRFFTKRALYRCLRNVGIDPIEHGYVGRFFPIPMAIHVTGQRV